MGKSLVIVESPAKARTINKFLGKNFTVKASMGHVRDLPKKQIGVDEKNDFKPTYEILAGRKKVIEELGHNPVLLCWEKPGDFCHRMVVADWLRNSAGIEVRELDPDQATE